MRIKKYYEVGEFGNLIKFPLEIDLAGALGCIFVPKTVNSNDLFMWMKAYEKFQDKVYNDVSIGKLQTPVFVLGNEIAFIKTYIFPDETTVTIFEDLFSGFKIIKVNGEWVNDISSAPKDNIQKTFLRNVRLDDLQIWNFTKNKFSSHCYNFCKISDLEDPIAIKIDTDEPGMRTFNFDDATCKSVSVYTTDTVDSAYIVQINGNIASITGKVGDELPPIKLEHLEFWKQLVSKYQSWIVNYIVITEHSPNQCLNYNGSYKFLLNDQVIVEAQKRRNGGIHIVRVNGKPAKLSAKVGGNQDGTFLRNLTVVEWKIWNTALNKYGGKIINGINLRDMSEPSLVSKTIYDGIPYFIFVFPELYSVGLYIIDSDPTIAAMNGHGAMLDESRFRKVEAGDLDVWKIAVRYNAGMQLNHTVIVDNLPVPTNVTVTPLNKTSNKLLGVNYKFYFGKLNIIIDVEKDFNESIDIVRFNDLPVIKTPTSTQRKTKVILSGYTKATEEIKRIWNIAKQRYNGLIVNDIALHRLNIPKLARITNTPSGKCFSIIFDLNSKIDVALLDSTYTVTKVNGKTPIISGPDEMHFDADILNIWNQTLRKYNNFELNGIEIGGLSYPTQVKKSSCGEGIHLEVTDFSGHTVEILNTFSDDVQITKIDHAAIIRMKKVNIYANDAVDDFMNLINTDGDDYLSRAETRRFINKYPYFNSDYLNLKINLTNILCNYKQKIPTSIFRELISAMRYRKIVDYFVYGQQ